MKIVVLANDAQWEYLETLHINISFQRVYNVEEFKQTNADAFFNFTENAAAQNYDFTKMPVLINSVIETLSTGNFDTNVIRVNAWPGFFEANTWEVAGLINDNVKEIFACLHKKYIITIDEPGFISARIISMIINEAFFALENNVSSKADIDIAMKLGTNYPYGPFEWATKIGLDNVYSLLKKLSTNDVRYTPSLALQNI